MSQQPTKAAEIQAARKIIEQHLRADINKTMQAVARAFDAIRNITIKEPANHA